MPPVGAMQRDTAAGERPAAVGVLRSGSDAVWPGGARVFVKLKPIADRLVVSRRNAMLHAVGVYPRGRVGAEAVRRRRAVFKEH